MELSNKKQYEENQNIYQSVEHIISKLNYENIENLVISTLEFFDENFPNSFHLLIYQIIFSHCFLPKRDPCLYINYLKNLETKEEELLKNKYQIIKGFKEFLLIENSYSQESYYILEKMIEDKLIDSNFPKNTLYFAHFMTKDEIYHYTNLDIASQFFQNYEELTKNDFKLHKKYVKEGVNPNEIAKIIRNDEIEKLQEISSQSNFDFNQIIEPSLYERCDFINQRNVSLIDYAAFFSSIKCFKYLLVNGAKVENTGKYAVAGGNEEIIHLCEQNHSTFEDAYETAIEFHRNDIFEYLYENKIIKIDDIEELGKKAICFCNFEILSLLEYKGMKITDNIIKEAASYGNIFLVKFFLKKNQIPKDILLSVITFNYVELVEFLIKQKGIDINAKDNYENTALIWASSNGHTETVKLLLEHEGIDINAKDKDGKTALMYATKYNYIEIVKLLLEQKGIDINDKTCDGYTALILASSNGHIEIVQLLLKQEGIDINAKDRYENTALIWASENGHTEIVKLLLKQEGIDINAKDWWGETALNKASSKGHTEIVKLLLKQEGIDINAKDYRGETTLNKASYNGNLEIVKLLLEQKEIDINAKDNYENTALITASKNGHTEIVKLLLEQEGIEINAKDKGGNTAIIAASTNGHTEVVKLLNEKGAITEEFE